MQVVEETTLPDGTTEFYFSDGSYAYAKQQHNLAGAPWLKYGEWEAAQVGAVCMWSACSFVN